MTQKIDLFFNKQAPGCQVDVSTKTCLSPTVPALLPTLRAETTGFCELLICSKISQKNGKSSKTGRARGACRMVLSDTVQSFIVVSFNTTFNRALIICLYFFAF